MKNNLIIILAFLLCVLLTACSGSENKSNSIEIEADGYSPVNNKADGGEDADEAYGDIESFAYDKAETGKSIDAVLGYIDSDYESPAAEMAAPAAIPEMVAEGSGEIAGAGTSAPAEVRTGGAYREKRITSQSGQLTAGEWSDIKNYAYYLNLLKIADTDSNVPENQRRRGFSEYAGYFGFETRYMFTVSVTGDDTAANDAEVELYDSNQVKLFATRTDVRGNAYLFPVRDLTGENITVTVNSGSFTSSQSFVYSQPYLEVKLNGRADVNPELDIMFVVDTTGSMGDELEYLKQEIADVIDSVSRENPYIAINLALLFYRDIGDEYVTKYFDFTTDVAAQQRNLSQQRSDGGGDFPEAVDIALAEALEQNWSGEGAVRLIFHVCDAPPHDTQENQTRYSDAIMGAAEKGISIIPVASSGVDKATEYLLRQEAIMTGGTYIFLTDDSGIGESHLEPTIGEYTVEYLNACIVRVINEYITGVKTAPVSFNR